MLNQSLTAESTILVPLAMFGWIPLVLALFTVLPARRAVIAAFILGWLFLPLASYDLPGLPDYNKMAATCLAVLLGVLIFDLKRIILFRPGLVDLPILIWCLIAPLGSSLSNNLGIYDGLSNVLSLIITWGIPYLIGRLYFNDPAGLRELAAGIFIGGLIYIPLILLELRLAPQLHKWVYGYHQDAPSHWSRFGGWRPDVFMKTGLMVSVWMASATVVGGWLWLSGTLRRLWRAPIVWLIPILLITTILLKSVNGWALLLIGVPLLFVIWRFQTALPLLVLIILIPLYLVVRTTGSWSGEQLVRLATVAVGESRARSLKYRLNGEDVSTERIWQRPIWGWGGWGRSAVYSQGGRIISAVDSLWITTFARYGLFGLTGLFVTLLLPPLLVLTRYPARRWVEPDLAPAAVLAVILVLYTIDNLVNSMVNPIYMLVGGAIVAFWISNRNRNIQAEMAKTVVKEGVG